MRSTQCTYISNSKRWLELVGRHHYNFVFGTVSAEQSLYLTLRDLAVSVYASPKTGSELL